MSCTEKYDVNEYMNSGSLQYWNENYKATS